MSVKINSFDFVLDDESRNGTLRLTFDYFDSGHPITETYDGFHSHLTMTVESSHRHPQSLEFFGKMLTPENLRELADKLEQVKKETIAIKNQRLLEKAPCVF